MGQFSSGNARGLTCSQIVEKGILHKVFCHYQLYPFMPSWKSSRLPNQYPRSWKVCYSAYWRECRHRSPFHHPRPGLPTWRLCCRACFQGYRPRPRGRDRGPMRRDWAMVVCFSCGKEGHGVGWCPKLNETFPFMLPGWTAWKVGGSYVISRPSGRGTSPEI